MAPLEDLVPLADTADAPGGQRGLTLFEAGRRMGHFRWLEMRTFEVLGGWVPSVPEPEVKLALAAESHRHAWHAAMWSDLLPSVAGIDAGELTRPANDRLVAFMDALSEPTGPDRTVDRLVGVYRVLVPYKVAAYAEHLRTASAAADAPVLRWLRLALRDEVDGWRDGELLVQSLLSPEGLKRVSDHRLRLEALMLAAGGVAGAALGG